MERKAAALQREIDEDERRRIKERAEKSPSIQGLDLPVHKLHVSPAGVKLTRAQQRVLLNRFLVLCTILAGMIFFLWKAIR